MSSQASAPSPSRSVSPSASPSPSFFIVADKFGNHYESSELKMLIIGLLLSAALYGVLLMLCVNCFYLISSSSGAASHAKKAPTRMRLFLFTFLFYMCLLGTIAFIFNIIVPINLFITPAEDLLKLPFVVIDIIMAPASSLDLALNVLATWGSHGFLFWRCLILYEGISPIKRIALRIFLSLVALTELAFGAIGLSAISFKIPWSPLTWLDTFEVISLCVNIVLSGVLISRILYHQWHLRKVFGQSHVSSYNRIVMICVESSLMTLILDILLLISIEVPVSQDKTLEPADRTSPFKFLFYKLLVYFNTIAPVLIVLRVARGKENAGNYTVESRNENGQATRSRGRISTLQFGAHTSTSHIDDSEEPVHDEHDLNADHENYLWTKRKSEAFGSGEV